MKEAERQKQYLEQQKSFEETQAKMNEAEAEQKKLLELIKIKEQKEQDLKNFLVEQERRTSVE